VSLLSRGLVNREAMIPVTLQTGSPDKTDRGVRGGIARFAWCAIPVTCNANAEGKAAVTGKTSLDRFESTLGRRAFVQRCVERPDTCQLMI